MQTFTKTTRKSIRGFYRFMGTLIVFMMAFTFTVQAQIPVTVTGETNTTPALATSYTSLSLALSALNATTAMTGPVTFTLNAGASETAPATGFVIGSATLNPVLSATNTVTIVKASGAATTINAGTGTATPTSANPDGMLKIVGADYITIDGLTFNDGNVTNPQTMEFGIGLFKLNAGDGAQNNTIQNCTINMQRINNASSTAPMVEGSVGIAMLNASNGAATTVLTITAASGTNSNNKFYSNSINGGNYGMALIGFAGSTPFTTCDQGTIVGASGQGNTILNFGGGAAANPSAGIRTLAQYGISIGYNTVNNNNGSGVNHATTLRGIYLNTATSASATITNNTVSLQSGATTSICNAIDNQSGSTAASNTIDITNNTVNIGYPTATSGVYTAINNGSSAATVNITGNTITQISGVNLAGTGTHVMIETGSPTTANANNNTIQNITRNGASGSWRGVKTTSPSTFNANNNTIENISWSAVASTGSFDGIYSFSSAVTVNANNNIIRNISLPTTGTVRGIVEFGLSGTKTIQNNQIYNFFTTAGGAGGASFTGINTNTGTVTISGNLIYDLNSTGTTGGTGGTIQAISLSGSTTTNAFGNKIYGLSSNSTNPAVNGISVSSGTTLNVYNNLVGNLTAPAANAANPVNGLNLTGGTTVNAYYNTIYINASSSGALFGSSAVTFSSSTPTLNLRNNILVNTSSFNSTGLTAALRRTGGTTGVIPSNYAATSNNNIFYAGTPGASNLLYVEGTTTVTNPQSSLAGLKSFMVSRDQASFTENPPFLSTTGSSSDFLHINTAIPTLAEGKAVTISGFTDDFDGNTRNVSTPDIGADEFTGTPVIVVAINSVSASPTGNLCVAAGRTITANVTVGGTAVSSVVLNYSFNGVAQTPITMTGGDPNIGQTSDWTASLPVASPSNASVTWSVTATDGVTNASVGGTSYADEPLTGVTGTATASVSPVCEGSPSVLTAVFSKTGLATIGAGGSTSSGTAASFFPGSWGGAKTQYIVRASELTAAGLVAGPITSLGFDVTVVGQTYQGFTVQLAHTTQTAMTTTFINSGFTQVYKGTLTDDGYLPTVGVNTLAFGTGSGSSSSFTWDGSSNIVVSICWSRVPAASTSTSSTMRVDAAGFTCSAYEQSDLETPAAMCGKTTADGTGGNRPQFRFAGQVAPTFASYTWNDGTSDIGTGNPFTVNPTSTTTYTATATDANGCTVTSSSVTVNTTALPAAPSGAPSVQCGTGVPGVFVAGSSPGNYRWYTVPTGGSPIPGENNAGLNLANGGTGTYTISTTTTFYVSIFDGTCESLRTPVVASVNAPDPVSATSNGPVCANTPLTLTANVTAGTNGNVYTYTWSASPATGSGIPTTVPGGTGTFGSPASTNVTPTAGGTYVYTVDAVDATLGCNTSATVTVTINALPSINTPTATPSVICAGAPVVLTASTTISGPGTATIGTATTLTGATSQPTAFCNRWPSYRMQTLFTAAELQATGMVAGNITSMAFNITTLGDEAFNDNFVVKIGTTTSTAMTAFENNAGYTTVFPAQTYTHAIGLNTINFSTPFNWDGTSNIIVEVQHDGADNINNSQTYYTATAGNTVAYTLTNASNSASLSTNRLNVVFGAQVGTTGPGTYTWSWNNGGGTGASVTVNPVTTPSITYTVTATDGNSCSSTADVTVTVNPIPGDPTGTGSEQCGTAIPTASVSSNSSETTPIFKWYDAPTAGTLLQTDPSTTYLSAVSTTTTFYVSEITGAGCESGRTPVTVTVSSPDVLTVSATSTSICVGSSFDLSSSYTPDFNNFATFDLTATGGAASGVNGTVSLTPNATGSDPFTITPTTPGTYVYTVTAFDPDKGCTSIGTVSVTVNPYPPTITSVSATPSTICAGATVTLAGVITGITPGIATVGAGGTTSSSTAASFFPGFWGGAKTQYIVRASELTAANLVAGPITSLGFDVTVVGQTYQGFTVQLAHTTQTAMTTTFIGSGFTQVYKGTLANDGYLPTTGVNTLAFGTGAGSSSSFTWNGTDNIVVSICWSRVPAASTSSSSTMKVDAPGFTCSAYEQSDSETPANMCAKTTADGTGTSRPQFLFNGLITGNTASSYDWSWDNGGGTGATVTVSPSTTTTYTATVSTTGTSCSITSDPVTVTVNPLPLAPTTNSPVTRCGPGAVTLTATGAGGTLNWYNVATGGTSLATGGTYSPNVTASTSFWVEETSAAGCIGPRSEVVVTVTAAPSMVITASGATTFCAGGSVGLDAASASDPSYINFAWSPATGLSATNVASVTANPSTTQTYTVTADDGISGPAGCSNTATITVTVNPNPTISSFTATPSTTCAGGSVVLTAKSIPAATGTTTIGTQTTTEFGGGVYRNGFGTGDFRHQLLYTAAELTAGGLAPGNITSAGFTVTSAGSGTANNYTIRLAHTAATSLTSTFTTATFTTCYVATTYTAVSGLNTHTFSTPFNWDGTSNLLVEICYNISSLGGTSTLAATTPGSTSNINLLGTAGACTATGGATTYANRPLITFGGQVGTDVTTSFLWTFNPGTINAGATGTTTVNPTSTTSYTVTATDPVTFCTSNAGPITVTVENVGATASASATTICTGTSVTLGAGATGGGPFTYQWNDGTSNFSTDAAPVVTPTTTTTYTVTVTDACLNSTTSSVTVTVNPLPTASIQETGPISICFPSTQTLTAVTNAASPSYQWKLNGVDIPSATAATYLISGSSTGAYTVVVTDGVTGCVSAVSAPVTVTINQLPAAITMTPTAATICNGSSVTITADSPAPNGAPVTSSGTISVAIPDVNATGISNNLTVSGIPVGVAIDSAIVQFNITHTFVQDLVISLEAPNGQIFNLAGGVAPTSTGSQYVSTRISSDNSKPALSTGSAPYTGTFKADARTTGFQLAPATLPTTANFSDLFTTPNGVWKIRIHDDESIGSGTLTSWSIKLAYSTPIPTYSWSPATGLNVTNAATVIASPSTTTTYTVTATTPAGCTATNNIEVVVNERPTAVISGSGVFCEGAANASTNLSIAFTGTAPWNYTYTVNGGSPVSGTTSSNPLTVTVDPGTGTPGLFTYEVSALSDANCASIGADLTGSGTVTVNPLAATPTANVTQPTCAVATGSITMTAPLGAGNSYTLDGTTTITWPTITFTGVATGSHNITVVNSFGCSAPASLNVTVDPQPFIPTAPVVTGLVNVCPFIGVAGPAGEVTYTATTTGNGTQTFNWTLPPNVTVVSGLGTGTLVLRFNTGFAAQANKQLRVTVSNQCGTSAQTIYYLLAQLPSTPGAISGPNTACAFIGSGTATYSVAAVPGTASYLWTVPANASIVTGQGTNTITVSFGSTYATGAITVASVNDCGTSPVRSLTVTRNNPSTPSLISGPTNVCPHILPAGTAATYTVAAVPSVTTYTWTVPVGASIVTGQGTNTITVTYPSGFTSGAISVVASNGCGSSSARNLAVGTLQPATPGVIDVINTQTCPNREFTYTIAAMPANATSVLWTVPSGATLVSGQGTTSITVQYPGTAVDGFVTAQGVNNCGVSVIRSVTVKLAACPPPAPFTKGVTEVIAPVETMEVKVFPNPTVSDFKLQVITAGKEEISVRVLDVQGRFIRQFTATAYQTINLGAELKAGAYLIEVRQGKNVKTTRVLKF